MTLISLPEGRTVPAELGGGVAVVPLDGLHGCYTGLSGWMEHQWPELEFDDWFRSRAQREFWQARLAAVESLADDERPPELDMSDYPTDEYGIGDSPEQLLAHPELAWVHTDPREFVIVFVEMRRESQPAHQGWRFHKDGKYLGTHNVEMEYLADQDGVQAERIDSVTLYHVIHVTSKSKAEANA